MILRDLFFAIVMFGSTSALALSPLPPVELALYLGTSGCRAAPSVVVDVVQDTQANVTLSPCGIAPVSGSLRFTSSDGNAALPPAYGYNFAIVPPTAQSVFVSFRTPGLHTLTARDAANNVAATLTVNVLPAPILLEVGCPSLAIARAPTITIIGRSHAISVFNCFDTNTPPLSLGSSDPRAEFPSAARVYPPALGVPQTVGTIIFRSPGLHTVFLRDGDARFAPAQFNVLPGEPSVAASAVPVDGRAALFGCALLVAGLAWRGLRRSRRT